MAADAASSDEWQFSAEIYGFLPDVEATSTSGDSMEIKIDDLLSGLDAYFSGALSLRLIPKF